VIPEPESEAEKGKPHGRELPSVYYPLGVQEQLPTFPGGASALRDYLREHVNAALQSGITPTDEIVYVRFKVLLDGTIREVEVRSSVNEEIDRAAIQIVKEMPHWSPARDWEDKPTMWSYTLPIQFKNQ
jgi:protein TonB